MVAQVWQELESAIQLAAYYVEDAAEGRLDNGLASNFKSGNKRKLNLGNNSTFWVPFDSNTCHVSHGNQTGARFLQVKFGQARNCCIIQTHIIWHVAWRVSRFVVKYAKCVCVCVSSSNSNSISNSSAHRQQQQQQQQQKQQQQGQQQRQQPQQQPRPRPPRARRRRRRRRRRRLQQQLQNVDLGI